MNEKKINNEFDFKINKLEKQLSGEEKKFVHFNSLRNFSHHIVKGNPSKKTSNKLLQVNIGRNKELIMEYLAIIENGYQKFDSDYLFKEYVEPIGEFMNRNYKFSFIGRIFLFFQFIKNLLFGLFTDAIVYYFFWNKIFFIGSVVSVLYTLFKFYSKKQQGKIYGPNY